MSGFEDPLFIEHYEAHDGTRTEDIPFYVKLANRAKGRVLDAGCGSGRILLPILRKGVEAYGIDSSPEMLARCRAQIEEEKLKSSVWQAELEAFNQNEHPPYSLIICAYNTFLHLMTVESQIAVLSEFHKTLARGGKLAMDLTSPVNFDIFSLETLKRKLELKEKHDNGEEVTVWRRFERDPIGQTGVYHREITFRGKQGKRTTQSAIPFRWVYPNEMRLLLKLAGFGEMQVFGGFGGEALTEDSEFQVWVAGK